MRPVEALARGGFVAAACVACCAPPAIAALGVTVGLAATAGVFLGLAAAIAVGLTGAAWIAARAVRPRPRPEVAPPDGPVPVAMPSRRVAGDELPGDALIAPGCARG